MERRLLSRRLLKAEELSAGIPRDGDGTDSVNTNSVAATEATEEEQHQSNFLFKQASSELVRHPVALPEC